MSAETLAEALTALDINPADYEESIDAQREFAEYLLAQAIQDLWLAGELMAGREVVALARTYWPVPADA